MKSFRDSADSDATLTSESKREERDEGRAGCFVFNTDSSETVLTATLERR